MACTSQGWAQVSTTYGYDVHGQVTAVARPGNTVTYNYDAAGNRTALNVVYPPPVAAGASLSVAFGGSANLALPISGQATGAVIDSPPSKGTVSLSSTIATYTASGSNYGADNFTYHAVGSGGNSAVQTVSVTIANPPAPSASPVSTSTAYNTAKAIALAPSGVYTGLNVASGPAHGSASISGTTATYTPISGYVGADSFTYTATGPGGPSGAATVSVTVNAPAPPTVANTSLTSAYNGAGSVALPISGAYTSIAFPNAPAHGALSLSGATVTYVTASGYYGADSFTYNAAGPGGTSGTATVSVTVPAPAAPTVGAVSASTAYNTAVSIGLAPSGLYSSLAVASGPAHGSASISGTTATYTPTGGYSGTDSFTYTASGPGGTSAPATVSVTVAAPVNHAPVAVNDPFYILQTDTQPIYVLSNDSDPDGDPLTIISVSTPVRTGGATFGGVGSVTIEGDHLSYFAPLVSKFATGEYKSISFTYTISDGRGLTSTATVNVTVEGS